MYSNLTEKQIEILNFIKLQINKKGYPPSVREICSAVNLKSTSTVHSHLNKLEEKGYIRKDPTKPRAIEILDFNNENFFSRKETIDVPLVGSVTAGSPILAMENIEDFIPLPSNLIEGGINFMLKVKGDSMISAGILDGDYIIVSKKSVARNGEIVVVLTDDNESTVKRFFKEKDKIRLQPENPYMEPIYLDDVKILGTVKGVFRVIK
ncbi:transcriptional repressor LexA [Tepidibacter formicigenes]|uniref:LexA repressor n=1 Tax=Tepidibacter formicigenes DSM 15518 TaxID=1123349 RepID=A0A1M6M5F4_9FIRM|nr:transcriptional repressor LexA [Tepidibacter formicigenes]SHJ78513.1 SOS-response transcriptional repressor, LexA [Tepidibacter formicigenes DSM 15518]